MKHDYFLNAQVGAVHAENDWSKHFVSEPTTTY